MYIAIGSAQPSQSIRRGSAYARTNCVRCHNTEKEGESPLKLAPPFREMEIRYLIQDLIRPLTSGSHPPMPVFDVSRDQAMDLIAFIKSLR